MSESVAQKRHPPSVWCLEHVQLLNLDSPAEVEGAGLLQLGQTPNVPGQGPGQGVGLLHAVRAGDDGGTVQSSTQHRRILSDIERVVEGIWQPKRREV